MKTVGVICEYNPFHNGHAYHLAKIREEFGNDTVIIVLMSGNYTQRGELAVTDKFNRAAMAILGGADLVLELPFPFSMQSAELFANAGVSVFHNLGCIDVLSFGSECGDLNGLQLTSDRMLSDDFSSAMQENSLENDAVGFPKKQETIFASLYGKNAAQYLSGANNTLAICYLSAMKKLSVGFSAHTVKRMGETYASTALSDSSFSSATAIRNAIARGGEYRKHLPLACADYMERLRNTGRLPSDPESLFSAVVSRFLIFTPQADTPIFDACDGLYNRFSRFAKEATSLSALLTLSETKKYTRSRVCRALWNSFFGVTSSEVKVSPAYTQLLGANAVGLSALKRMKKTTDFPVLTKPADVHKLNIQALRQKELSDKADMMYSLTLPCKDKPADAFRFSPFIVF